MNGLTKFLVEGILGEEKKEVVALYAGGFKPPTAGHFLVVEEALKQYPEIDKLVVLVGSGIRDGIEQTESLLVWEIYQNYLPMKVEIQAPKKPPINAVYSYAKDNPEETIYWILGAREGKEEDTSDIAKRTAAIDKKEDKYNNVEVKIIRTSNKDMSGTNARKALRDGDKEAFSKFIPTQVEEKDEIFNILRPAVTEGKDPKKGTGKKPKGSSRRLYTDEDPKDTVGVKFSSRQDIVDTLNKKSFKAKSHARQSQIINLIHQRVRAAYNRAKDPDVKRRLKTALDYAEERKEASKAKTQRLKKQKNENVAPNHDGKAAPFGSGYDEVKEQVNFKALEKQLDNMFAELDIDVAFTNHFKERVIERGLTEEDIIELANKIIDQYPDELDFLDKDQNIVMSHLSRLVDIAAVNTGYGDDYLKDLVFKTAYKRKDKSEPEFRTNKSSPRLAVNENTMKGKIDILPKIGELTLFMIDNGMNVEPLPSLEIIEDDVTNAEDFFGKTAYYDPDKKHIVLYTHGRHPKDVVRSYAHEMIHHIQNLEGRLGNITTTNTQEDDRLNDIEAEANLNGTMTFRNWTDSLNEGKQVGTIYHYTTFEAGLKILQSNQLKSSGTADSTKNQTIFGISFTRDKRFHDNHNVGFDESSFGNTPQLRFTIDGNKLSNRFSVQPYSQGGVFDKGKKSFEAEERVISTKPFSIPLSDYLISIDVLVEYKKPGKDDWDMEWDYETYAPIRAKIIKFAQSKNLPINLIVNKNGDPWPDKVKETLIKKILNWFTIQEANLKGTMTFRNWTDSLNKTELDEDGQKVSDKNMDDYKKSNNPSGKVKDPFGLNAFSRELSMGLEEEILTEGRYDKLANQLSSIAFEAIKDGYDVGRKVLDLTFTVGPDDEDIISNDFEFDFNIEVEYTDDEYKVDGGANAGFDDKDEEITPLLTIRFKIPKNIDWQTVSFDLKDVVRHELEHLTQDGENVKPGKQMEDDQLIRKMIDSDVLPKAEYFKLEKEVDAMLQGLYFKAKKSKRPYIEVIDDYLDKQPISQQEREDILDLWRSRTKALSLPLFENEEKVMDYRIFLDMDGVLVDFDQQFKDLTGMMPREFESKYSTEEFWETIDKAGVGFWRGMKWMPGGEALYNRAAQHDHFLLSSPSRSEISKIGKRLWRKDKTPNTKLYLARSYNKRKFAAPNHILIDDRADNIQQWKDAGGIGILYKSADQVNKELDKLGL